MNKKQKRSMRKNKKKELKKELTKGMIQGLYECNQFEPLTLLSLALVPNGKYVSQHYIRSLLTERKHDKYSIMLTLSWMARKGLVEKHSLLQYRRKQNNESKNHQRLVKFVKKSVVGPVMVAGNAQTQNVYRLTKKGRQKLELYQISQKFPVFPS